MSDLSNPEEAEKRIWRIGTLWFGAVFASGICAFFLEVKLLDVTNLGFYALLIGLSLPALTLIAGVMHLIALYKQLPNPEDDDPDPEDKAKVPEITENNSSESNVLPLFPSSDKEKKAA